MGRRKAIDAIRRYYLNPDGRGVKLTKSEEYIRKRISSVWSMLCERRSVTDVVEAHMKLYRVSQSVAYSDVKMAIQLFGNVFEADKKAWRGIVLEYVINTYRKAEDAGDYKAMAQASKAMITLLGLDRDDPETPDFEKLKPSLVVAVLPDGMEKKIDRLLSGGAINMNKTIDVPHEELESQPGGGPEKGN